MAADFEYSDEAVITSAVEALAHDSPDSEALALRLAELSEPVLEKNIDRIGDALFATDPVLAMRVLNVLPAAFTRRHAETYVSCLNHLPSTGDVAGAFVTFKARSVHRGKIAEWSLDKALWKWLRRSNNANIELVLYDLGPDWGALWADYTAVVFGAGRLSRKLHRMAARID